MVKYKIGDLVTCVAIGVDTRIYQIIGIDVLSSIRTKYTLRCGNTTGDVYDFNEHSILTCVKSAKRYINQPPSLIKGLSMWECLFKVGDTVKWNNYGYPLVFKIDKIVADQDTYFEIHTLYFDKQYLHIARSNEYQFQLIERKKLI